MTISMWTHAHRTSHSKIMGIHLELVPPCCYKSLNSSRKAFHYMLEHCCGDLLPFSQKNSPHFNSSQRCSLGLKSGLCSGQSFFHTDLNKSFSIWTSLCAHGHCHSEKGMGLPQTVATKLEAQNRLECHCML